MRAGPVRPAAGRLPLRRRIGFRILLAILAVAVSAVVVTGIAQYALASAVMRENVAQRNLQIARRAAGEIGLYIRSSFADLTAVEQGILPIRDPWVRDLVLENTVTIHRQFRLISVVGATGTIRASSALDDSEEVPEALVRRAIDGGGPALSPVELSADSLPYMTVALPARGGGADRTVVVAELMLRDVWDMVDGISFGDSGSAMLLSGDGLLIAHPDKTRVLSRVGGSVVASSVLDSPRRSSYTLRAGDDGLPTLVAVCPVQEVGWYVVVQQSLKDAYVPLGSLLANAGATVLVFVLVAALASFYLARRFSAPLERLVGGTERIRAGDLSHRIPVGSEDEIGRLSHAFNAMVQDLEERSERLSAYQQELRSLASQLALTEARERKRIAAEIHDRIGQALALTRIRLGLLARSGLGEEQAKVVGETLPLLEAVIQDTRTLIFSVSSPLLYEVGLGAALERLVEQFGAEGKAVFRYVERRELPKLETDVAVLLFDAVKELLVNTVKHAGARNVRVAASVRDGQVRLRVGDDGIGFEPGDPGRRGSSGYGLFSLKERLRYVGGDMEIRSRRGRGTLVTLTAPLRAGIGEGAGP
jgi:signal transduction histidine kinase